jgi:hypothetical protein
MINLRVKDQEGMNHLQEMVLDHLVIPRPGTRKHMQALQDDLLAAVLVSLAGGISAVSRGISELRGQGEPVRSTTSSVS